MPCRDDYSYEREVNIEQNRIKLDKVTAHLCGTLAWLCFTNKKTFDALMKRDRGLENWYNEHLKTDAAEKERIKKQEKKDELKRRALNKLTKEEKDVLGVTILDTSLKKK